MKRFLFDKILKHSEKKQIALLIGARQVGKSTLLHQLQKQLEQEEKTTEFLTCEDPEILRLFNQHPENLFKVIPPLNKNKRLYLFIDEIQYLDNPSNFLKFHYDTFEDKIKFIVSGSSSFYIDKKFKDSMAGRKRIFQMPTLSFEEMLFFRGQEKFLEFINKGKNVPKLYINKISALLDEYLIFGGYPEVVLENDFQEKKNILREIANSYVKKDALEANVKSPDNYILILKLLAGQIGQLLNANNISAEFDINRLTVKAYIKLMQQSFHISLIKPFHKNIIKELKKMPKVYFNDLGLRNFFKGDFSSVITRDDKGELFENYVFRKFSDIFFEDELFYWRTQNKLEVDFIINSFDAKTSAYEVKFNKKNFNRKKYKIFEETYPDISVNLISYDNILTVNFNGE